MKPQTNTVFAYDCAFAAMCIMEEIASPVLSDAGDPWQDYRDQVGINQLRDDILRVLAQPCDNAWTKAYNSYELNMNTWRLNGSPPDAQPVDPGDFDYQFVPFWLRTCVDWSDVQNGPRVRNTTVSAQN